MRILMFVSNVQHINATNIEEQRVTMNPVAGSPANAAYTNASLAIFIKEPAAFNQLLAGTQYLVDITEAPKEGSSVPGPGEVTTQ